MAITCRVRIFGVVDDENTPIRTHPGHYDLQILKTVPIGTTTNRETFVNPVISYGHGGLEEVAFFENARTYDIYDGYKVHLYHWDFSVDDTKVQQMLTAMGGYLDGDHPARDNTFFGRLVRYDVTKAPFNDYDANVTNCFRAVATWCNTMGKNNLKLIYDRAHGSSGNGASDYFAWNLIDLLADAHWDDQGIFQY